MKRLAAAVGIILLLFLLSFRHAARLTAITEELISDLKQVDALVLSSDWNGALDIVRQAEEKLEQHSTYLHTTLHHADLDGIRASLREVGSYLQSADDEAECLAVSARLVHLLELLAEEEHLSLGNIL